MHSSLLQDIALSLIAATLLGILAHWARQPLLLAYIAAGVLLGPAGLAWVHDRESVQSLAELGLALMLFIVGLEVDLPRLLSAGRRALPVTGVQVVGCTAVAWLAAWLMGYRGLEAGYLGVTAAFSSTMIVVALLTDRAELESTHGQLTLGILLLQDVAALLVLALQPSIGGGQGEGALPMWGAVSVAVGKAAALSAGAVLVSRYFLPLIFRFVSRAPEVVLLTALSWCFLVCYAAMRLEFSIAMGALIAGVSIAAFPYSLDVVAKIRGLKAFFATLFFVSLGMLMVVPDWRGVMLALGLSAAVVLGRFITVWPAARWFGVSSRVGLLSAILLAQTSEFGVIVALIGAMDSYKHIGPEVVSTVVMVMIITAVVSSYMAKYSHDLAGLLAPRAVLTEADKANSSVLVQDGTPAPIMLIGCFRVGSSLVHELRQAAIDFSVIDISQHVNDRLNALGVNTIYGDLSHTDTLHHAGVDKASILICSISDDFLRGTDNMRLLHTLRQFNPTARIIVTSESIEGASRLYAAGADYVIVPRVLLARHITEVIAEIGAGELDARRQIEIEHLPQRVEVVR